MLPYTAHITRPPTRSNARWQGTQIQLDYELKEKLFRKLGHAQGRGEQQTRVRKPSSPIDLPVVNGKVSFRPAHRVRNQEMEIYAWTWNSPATTMLVICGKGSRRLPNLRPVGGGSRLRRVRDDREMAT